MGRRDSKVQALVYDILPLEAGAGKRCSECGGIAQLVVRQTEKPGAILTRVRIPTRFFFLPEATFSADGVRTDPTRQRDKRKWSIAYQTPADILFFGHSKILHTLVQ